MNDKPDNVADAGGTTFFPALSILERTTPPLRYGRIPYWHAPVSPASKDVLIPDWNWLSVHPVPEGIKPMTLDCNGMYLAAIGGVVIAHSELQRSYAWETLPAKGDVMPGYYRITNPHWNLWGTIVSPLGDSLEARDADSLWIAAPTLVLLLELFAEGYIGEFTILDSWITNVTTTFRTWSARLKAVRLELLDQRDAAHTDAAKAAAKERLEAFKLGYSAALSMMLTGSKSRTKRPDWTHTVHAHAHAAQWRKAWRYTAMGKTLVRMGSTDEITIFADDLPEVMSRPKPPFRYDNTGRTLGAFKHKPESDRIHTAQRATDVPMVLESDGDWL